jgi:hypothetical protein
MRSQWSMRSGAASGSPLTSGSADARRFDPAAALETYDTLLGGY